MDLEVPQKGDIFFSFFSLVLPPLLYFQGREFANNFKLIYQILYLMRLCLGLLNIMDFMVMGGEYFLPMILFSVLSLSVTVSTAQGMAFTCSLMFAQCQSLSFCLTL